MDQNTVIVEDCNLIANTETDLEELQLLAPNINVWSANQEVLEEQALNELQLFQNETNTSNQLEDGEIDEDSNSTNEQSKQISRLENYIKQQQEFKKRQDFHKSLTDKEVTVGTSKRKRHSIKSVECSENVQKIRKLSEVEEKDLYVPEESNLADDNISGSDSEYIPSEEDTKERTNKITYKLSKSKQTHLLHKLRDDANLNAYKERLDEYYKKLEQPNSSLSVQDNDLIEDVKLNGGFKLPLKIWGTLYGYQQEGIKWLWSIHEKSTGGILGDEMGLGKTVQMIVFLYGLNYSQIRSCHSRFIGVGPTLIVCPATVIQQWLKHFYEWASEFRVAILHQSGSYTGNKYKLIKEIHAAKGILLLTYSGILKYKGNLLEHNWHYVILDEGHKIRNSGAKVTMAVKEIRTPHRVMLTGSPMQNNLQELWSLFDFTNPGMLGNSSTFTEHFVNPILHGGFSNATQIQEATALSVATTLKNIITPYLFRRTKAEVQCDIELPHKSEQVLFCSLTDEQIRLYKDYLMGEHVNTILGRGIKPWGTDNYMRGSMLLAITQLRKICNHPDIHGDQEFLEDEDTPPEFKFGYYKKSGKMIVVSTLLKIWKKQKHRVLLFTQGRAMIAIFENFLSGHGYNYLKMDGSTSIGSRQPLINKFNQDSSYDVFLLTTKVGGLGVNLTGADRVIIYDPDWNPATDTQARERAWRIGQDKQVTIYRLLSAGTIEEKMYQRQVWKQLLCNKILIDPKTHRAFKSSDLYDLFSFQEPTSHSNPETTNIFHESRVKIQERVIEKQKKKQKKSNKITTDCVFSEDKIQQMKDLAQRLAKNLGKDKEEKKIVKTPYQKMIESERSEKLKQKEELKKLSAPELLELNKIKANQKKDISINKVDDCDTPCSFSKALEVSEKRSDLYRNLIRSKNIIPSGKDESEASHDGEHHRKRKKKVRERDSDGNKVTVDKSGVIDGEVVEGLVKREKKSNKSTNSTEGNSSDEYVLSKLFSKKGVSGALQHDSIVQGKVRDNNLRISTQASERADKSMQALRRNRVDNWRW